MPKSLSQGHQKFTIVVAEPATALDAMTATALNAGIDTSCSILESDFTFSAGDSDKVNEKPLCATNNANAIGADNFTAGVTVFRMFDPITKQADLTEDATFQALKAKGTTVWGFLRENAKASTEAWAEDDEYLWMELLTDRPQRLANAGGYIKRRIPMEPQLGGDGVVAATP